MTLHIFNPEHDIALASGLSNFTAPHAGRQLRHDIGFLPSLWAGRGDAVLVDDVEQAERAARRWKPEALFVNKHQLRRLPIDHVEPWGWDSALRDFLLRQGVDASLLPTDGQLDVIRQLSRRSLASQLLPQLRLEGTIGVMTECDSVDAALTLADSYGHAVMKAPWSSSGRGLRFTHSSRFTLHSSLSNSSLSEGMAAANSSLFTLHSSLHSWLSNVIKMQGAVMVEPYYHKVKDFAMEFSSDGEGTLTFEGLSLFHTQNGAYTGNLLLTGREALSRLSHFVDPALLTAVRARITETLGPLLSGRYRGPVGVDMMVCSAQSGAEDSPEPRTPLLHPCVEVNLRRTMGHVALALERRLNAADDDEVSHVMRIAYSEDNYKLTITQKLKNSKT